MTRRACFILLRDKLGLSDFLKRNGIVVTMRNGIVRISMHYYNAPKDVEKLIEAISLFNNQPS